MFKKIARRTLSGILSICLLAGLFGGLSLTAKAEEPDTTPPWKHGGGTTSGPSGSSAMVMYDEDVTIYYEYTPIGAEVPVVNESSPSVSVPANTWAEIPANENNRPALWNGGSINIYILAVDAAGNSSTYTRILEIPDKFNSSPEIAVNSEAGWDPVHVGTKARAYVTLTLAAEYLNTWHSFAGYYAYAVTDVGAAQPELSIDPDIANLNHGAGYLGAGDNGSLYHMDFDEHGAKNIALPLELDSAGAKDVYIMLYTPWGKVSDVVKVTVPAATAPLDRQWVFPDLKTNSREYWGVVGDFLSFDSYGDEFLEPRETHRGVGWSSSPDLFDHSNVGGTGSGTHLAQAGTGSIAWRLTADEIFQESRLIWNVRSFSTLEDAKTYKKGLLDPLVEQIDLSDFPRETQEAFAAAIAEMKADIDALETAEEVRLYDIDLSEWAELELPTYSVGFYDYDSTPIGATQTIEYGSAAIAPPEPSREGYTFAGWDTEFSFVAGALTITATYTQNASVPVISQQPQSAYPTLKTPSRSRCRLT